jgi:hypothetical protein
VVVSLSLVLKVQAEVLDRIVAVVEGRIVTLSDLRQEREIRAQMGEKPIDDDVTLAKELIDSYLIERQITDYPNIEVKEEEVEADIKKLNIADGKASQTLRDAVLRRIRIQKFIDLKFRDLIRPTDEDIRTYYEQVFLPEARSRGLQSVPPLTEPDMADAIRQNVVQERLDHEVDVWLEAIRRRSAVEIFE